MRTPEVAILKQDLPVSSMKAGRSLRSGVRADTGVKAMDCLHVKQGGLGCLPMAPLWDRDLQGLAVPSLGKFCFLRSLLKKCELPDCWGKTTTAAEQRPLIACRGILFVCIYVVVCS